MLRTSRILVSPGYRSKLPQATITCLKMDFKLFSGLFLWGQFERVRNWPLSLQSREVEYREKKVQSEKNKSGSTPAISNPGPCRMLSDVNHLLTGHSDNRAR